MLPYAGDHRRSPPPAAAAAARAAFSSSLSPSAAPFPADPGPGRDLPTAPSVYSAAGEWGSASWMEPPVSYMAPVAATPAPAAAAAAPTGYKGEDSRSAPYGIYSGNHFSTFAGLHSLRSEGSNSISEKHPGTRQESSEAISNGFGPSVFHQQQNAFVSKLLDHSASEDTLPYPPRQDLNQYPFGTAYDKYMGQLSSCSADKQPHILSARYVDSSEMAKSTVPVMNDTTGESSFSFSPYMNPCRINLDYFDCLWNDQKDLQFQTTTDKQHGKWNNSVENMATVGNYTLNPLGENHLGTERSENGRPTQEFSEMKHDLGGFNSKFSSSEVLSVQPREISPELLEVNNTTVDSPCWKGAPATYQPSFGISGNNDAPAAPYTVIGTVGYNSSHESQKVPELSSEYQGRLPEPEAPGESCSENDCLKMFKFPVMWQPINFRVHNDMATHASFLPDNDKQEAHTHNCYDFGQDSNNAVTSSQWESSLSACKPKLLGEHSGSHAAVGTEVTSNKVKSPIDITPRDNLTRGSTHGNSSPTTAENEQSKQKRGEDPSQCYPGAGGNMLNMSCDSSSSTRAIFLKLMHNLSVVLLSTCKGGSSLQEDEEELLHSVIQNLAAASCKRSKVEQKTDDDTKNSSQMNLKNGNSARNNFWMAMREHSTPENPDSEFKNTVSQVLNILPDDNMLDEPEVSQASIYKKLWIEAEASACKLKYELQLARIKLAMTKVHDSREDSKGSNPSISSSKPENLDKENISCAVALQCQGGDSGEDRQSAAVNRFVANDDDVFARLKVLQSRVDNVNSFGGVDSEEQPETSKKLYAVEDAVMSRLKILKSRSDNVTTLCQESIKHKLDSSNKRADNVHDALMARLRILESCPSYLNLVQQSSKQQLCASTSREDGVDDAVMARLRILKSRPDNIDSIGDGSEEHENACVKQVSKFLNSGDLADYLGNKDSVGDLDFADGTCVKENKAGGSANVVTSKSSKAPSDDMNNEPAVQSEDNFDFGENHVLPQTTGDPIVCTEGPEEAHLISSPVYQYGSSPPEWEHVLKENFFHPGK